MTVVKIKLRKMFILRKAKVHYLVHNSPQLAPVSGQTDPSHIRTDFVSLLLLPSHLRQGLPTDLCILGSHLKHFCANFLRHSGRGSVVGIASTLRTGRSGVRISVRARDFFFLQNLWTHPFSFFLRG